jgi:AraC-like DNA-binding protein
MARRSRVILVLHALPQVHTAVAQGAPRGSLVGAVAGWDELETAIKVSPPSTVAIVDPYHGGTAAEPAAELYDLLQRLPSTSVVPALEITAERAADVARLDEWGIAGLISVGHDDTPAGVGHRLAEACVLPLKRLLAALLPPDAAPHAYTLLFAATEAMCDGGTVADLAEAVDASPSTLLRWAESAGLPTPRTLLQWVRVLHAARLLDEPIRSVESVARTCGYASPAELRKVMLRLLGHTPAQLRSSAFDLASRRFLEILPH